MFLPAELFLNGYFFLFLITLCKLCRLSCLKIPGGQQFLNYSNQTVWHQRPCRSQSHRHHIFPHSDIWYEHWLKLLTCICICLMLWCWHMIVGSIIIWAGVQGFLLNRLVSVYSITYRLCSSVHATKVAEIVISWMNHQWIHEGIVLPYLLGKKT